MLYKTGGNVVGIKQTNSIEVNTLFQSRIVCESKRLLVGLMNQLVFQN